MSQKQCEARWQAMNDVRLGRGYTSEYYDRRERIATALIGHILAAPKMLNIDYADGNKVPCTESDQMVKAAVHVADALIAELDGID